VAEPSNEQGKKIVPKLLYARQPEDAQEGRKIRKLPGSPHAPGD
jgi:hypothetical protein